MRILGIDPGIDNIGFAVVDCFDIDRFSLISSFCSDVKSLFSKSNEGKRDSFIVKIVNNMINEIRDKYNPHFASIEFGILNSNPKTSLHLSFVKGIIVSGLVTNGIGFEEYHPTTVKKIVSGSGKSDKLQMQKILSFYFKSFKFKTSHESDAASIAICHYLNSTLCKRSLI